jgi:mono/diheme cytochrome c family protein
MHRRTDLRHVATVALVLATTELMGASAFAQAKVEPTRPVKDYLQRSEEILEFRRAAASGPDRGQEIFYYKCWMCHNEFAKGAPSLKGLFTHAAMVSGEPMSEEAVKNQIRNGSANMAAYKYALNDADVNDLLAYLKEKCCWDSDSPPPNPRYIAK